MSRIEDMKKNDMSRCRKEGKLEVTAREKPFLWTLLEAGKYGELPKPKVVPKPPKRTPPVRKRWSFSRAAKM